MKEKRGQVETEKGQEERDKGGTEKEEKEREVTEVKKDVMDWTVVRRNKRQRKRMVPIFVKMNECQVFPLDVSLDDAINDVIKQIQSDEEVYVTMHGRVLKRNDKLKSCGVTGGCTIQVTSRMHGRAGRHKNKKSKTEMKGDVDESGKTGPSSWVDE